MDFLQALGPLPSCAMSPHHSRHPKSNFTNTKIMDLVIGVQLKSEDGGVSFSDMHSLHKWDVHNNVQWEYLMEEFIS